MNQHVKVRENCVEVGRLAWQVLSGNWVKTILAGVVLVLSFILVIAVIAIISSIITMLFGGDPLVEGIMTVILAIMLLCAIAPLALGYYSFFLSICRGQGDSPLIVVKGFGNAGKAIGTGLLIAVFTFIGYIIGGLLQFLFFSVIFGSMTISNGDSGILAGFVIVCIAFIISFSIDFFITLLFSPAYFVIANRPSIGCFQVISECVNIMRGNILKKAILYLYLFLIAFVIQIPVALISEFLHGPVFFVITGLIRVVIYVALVIFAMACETVFYELASGHLGAAENNWKPVEYQPQGSMPYGTQDYAGEGFRREDFEPARETMESINFNFNVGDSEGEPLLSEQQKGNTNSTIDTINGDISGNAGLEQTTVQKPAAIIGLGQTAPEKPAVEANPVRNLNQAEPVGSLNQTQFPVDEMGNKNVAEKNVSEKNTVTAENAREDEAVTRTRKIIREMIECGDSSLESFIRRWEEQNSARFH